MGNKRKRKKQIKEKQVDALFSMLIRERDNWTCVRCGRHELPPTFKIQCSHFFRRGLRSVRFDKRNCDALCNRCHYIVENNKNGEYYDFKESQLGREGLAGLKRIAYQETKKYTQADYQEMMDQIKKEIEDIRKIRGEEVFGSH